MRLLTAAQLVQGDPCSGCAVQQPLEMKARKLVLRVLADVRGKRRHCAGFTRFELGKCTQIA